MKKTIKIGLIAAVAALALPGSAFASHIKGGSIDVAIDASGGVTGNSSWYENSDGEPCEVGVDTHELYSLDVTGPSSSSGSWPNTPTITCVFSNDAVSIYSGALAPTTLADIFGSSPGNGIYEFNTSDCCMVDGIIHSPSADGFSETAKVTWTSGSAAKSPRFTTDPLLGFSRQKAFLDKVKTADTTGNQYSLILGEDSGDSPESAFTHLTVNSKGELKISKANAATFVDGDAWVYRVKVQAANGNYSTRTVLMVVGLDTGQTPVFEITSKPVVTPSKNGVGLSLKSSADGRVNITGFRKLKQKTGEKDPLFRRKGVQLSADNAKSVILKFTSDLARTMFGPGRGFTKGVNPIKVVIKVSDGQGYSKTFLVKIPRG
ncbi:MAG: hypothetical protein ACKOBH_01245 [bacterium]